MAGKLLFGAIADCVDLRGALGAAIVMVIASLVLALAAFIYIVAVAITRNPLPGITA